MSQLVVVVVVVGRLFVLGGDSAPGRPPRAIGEPKQQWRACRKSHLVAFVLIGHSVRLGCAAGASQRAFAQRTLNKSQ